MVIAKASAVMLTRCLAVELGSHNIRVNAIAPGLVKVDRNQFLWDSPEQKRTEAETALGRLGEPSDITGAALFLASDASSFVTGHTIAVDGGRLT